MEEDAAKDTTTSSAEEKDPLERRHEVLTDELIPTKEEAKKRKYEEPPDFKAASPLLEWIKEPPTNRRNKMQWLFEETSKPKPKLRKPTFLFVEKPFQ